MPTFQELARSSGRELEKLLAAGRAPALESLKGFEFDGANVGFWADLPFTVTLLGIGNKKFRKGFYQGPDRDPGGPAPFIQGYNVLIAQDSVDKPWSPLPAPEKPKRFGFYRVHSPVAGSRDAKYPNALLLDYSRGGNGFSTTVFLRDYIAQVDPADPDLLVGKAYLALGPIRIFGSYFLLRRAVKHDFVDRGVPELPPAKRG